LTIDLYASSSLLRVIPFCLSVSLAFPGLSDVCAMNLFAYVRKPGSGELSSNATWIALTLESAYSYSTLSKSCRLISISGYGAIIFMNRPVGTRTRGGVGAGV